MADRRAEIARKKAQIEQLRKERMEKERAKKGENQSPMKTASQASTDSTSNDPDALFRDLGIPISEGHAATTVGKNASASAPSQGDASAAAVTQASPRRKKNVQLSVVKVNETNIPPRENVAYSKETQTVNLEPVDKEDDDTDSLDVSGDHHHHSHQARSHHGMPHVQMVAPSISEEEQQRQKEEEEKAAAALRELSEEEKQQICMSEDFQLSVSRAARVMQRMLAINDTGLTTDYSGADTEGKDDDQLAGERLKLQQHFYDERWSRRRTITSMDWSPQFPELLVASYNANEDAPNDPDGVALIWNLKYKNMAPEYIFHCQSSVTSTCFAQFHPNMVIGGTYSGRIVLWDNRVNKRTPVQRTPLSATSHTHPVYCVNVVGTQNAHNLISVSTDGKVCSWSLDMLSQPQDSMELQTKQNKPVAATCFSFLSGDANNFIVGSEECLTYSACRHGSKAGINDMFEGHQGPVTSIDSHRVPGQIDFSPYFLTSSFDWTIKLWSMKQPYYIHSFEDNSDYVYDVRWSPIHPALFASVDGEGRLDLWNLNNESEVPTASVVIDGRPALNQCRWHQSGHHISVGDNAGRIHLYDVGEHMANPKSDEWSKFVHTLQELKQHAAERVEDSTQAGTGGAPLR
ncbi:cytoplasmic dynein 1 intermediate chain 2 [Plakobranchus ocellatus]|uniref:Cytoplasmic dynein 1 intermediate chain 2 n=1 Tax=Plakobranchus ocellatus TaxID=259542 RepID=A0AAV4BN82_9GAST|nr:cytoplasmic dynein 1 intermediate chain 2 [Plakobranchus ocellatus]